MTEYKGSARGRSAAQSRTRKRQGRSHWGSGCRRGAGSAQGGIRWGWNSIVRREALTWGRERSASTVGIVVDKYAPDVAHDDRPSGDRLSRVTEIKKSLQLEEECDIPYRLRRRVSREALILRARGLVCDVFKQRCSH